MSDEAPRVERWRILDGEVANSNLSEHHPDGIDEIRLCSDGSLHYTIYIHFEGGRGTWNVGVSIGFENNYMFGEEVVFDDAPGYLSHYMQFEVAQISLLRYADAVVYPVRLWLQGHLLDEQTLTVLPAVEVQDIR